MVVSDLAGKRLGLVDVPPNRDTGTHGHKQSLVFSGEAAGDPISVTLYRRTQVAGYLGAQLFAAVAGNTDTEGIRSIPELEVRGYAESPSSELHHRASWMYPIGFKQRRSCGACGAG